MNFLKHKDKIVKAQLRNSTMSTRTRDFIQKICYKRTASVDMTQQGFSHDSKLYHINLLLRPLREKIHKICGKPEETLMQGNSTPQHRKFELNRPKLTRKKHYKDSRKLKNAKIARRRKK